MIPENSYEKTKFSFFIFQLIFKNWKMFNARNQS